MDEKNEKNEIELSILEVLAEYPATKENSIKAINSLASILVGLLSGSYIRFNEKMSYNDLEKKAKNFFNALKEDTIEQYRYLLISEKY